MEPVGVMPMESGMAAQAQVVALLRERGWVVYERPHLGSGWNGAELRGGLWVEGVPGHHDGLVVLTRSQQVPGTADEKLPAIWANIGGGHYPAPVLVVLVGDGFRSGAVDWLRARVDGERLIGVLTLEGFTTWLQRH